MFTQLTKTHAKFFASAAVVLTVAGVFIARTAFAKLAANTIDPIAMVTDNGRQVVLTGPVSCTDMERIYLRVTLTQRSTGAIAEGSALLVCTGDIQHWEVRAVTQGNASFQEGPATAVALARTTSQGETTDAHQWLVNVTLATQ
jgi:hypothetical protein